MPVRGDPIFKGCTRPAMLWGVPIVPFVAVFGAVALLAVWVNFFLFVLLLPTYFLMRLVVKNDDQAFRHLWLRTLFRLVNTNRNGSFWQASVYSPVTFKKRKGQ